MALEKQHALQQQQSLKQPQTLKHQQILKQYSMHAKVLIDKHLGSVWRFEFDRAVRRAGVCKYDKKVISVSRHFAISASLDQLEQVVLHEIAHALAGPKAAHGSVWKEVAAEIGYRGERTIAFDMNVKAPWRGFCPAGHTFERFKRPVKGLSCGACSTSFSPKHLITWEYLQLKNR